MLIIETQTASKWLRQLQPVQQQIKLQFLGQLNHDEARLVYANVYFIELNL